MSKHWQPKQTQQQHHQSKQRKQRKQQRHCAPPPSNRPNRRRPRDRHSNTDQCAADAASNHVNESGRQRRRLRKQLGQSWMQKPSPLPQELRPSYRPWFQMPHQPMTTTTRMALVTASSTRRVPTRRPPVRRCRGETTRESARPHTSRRTWAGACETARPRSMPTAWRARR